MTDTDRITFGKYKGKMLGEIPAHYMLWLYKELAESKKKSPFIKEMVEYLTDNLEYYNQQINDSYITRKQF